MHKLLLQLNLDHRNLARLLEVLEKQLDDFHAGQEHDIDLMCELVEYINCYEDQVHHPTEDLLFVRFKARTQEKRVAVETLEEQHVLLAEMTRQFRASLQGMMYGEVLLRHEVEAQGRAMLKVLRQHMDLEEGEVFPLIDERLLEEDWIAVEKAAPRFNDPLFGALDLARFRNLYKHLSEELGLPRDA